MVIEINGIITNPIDLSYKWTPISPIHFSGASELKHSTQKPIKVTITSTQHEFEHPYLGFGYSFEPTSCQNLMMMPPDVRHHVLESMVDPKKGIGMNLWRICIGTPDFYGFDEKYGGFGFWYSYLDNAPGSDGDPLVHVEKNFTIEKDRRFIIPIVKEALQINPQIIIFASPWSPPGWMKNTGRMCGGRLLPQMRAAYALYLVKYIQAYKNEGIPIKAITVQNEPYHNWNPKKKKIDGKIEYIGGMPSCFWKAAEERDFIRDFLGPAFERAGLNTEIWCYDHNWDDIPWRPARYPHVVLNDPEAAKYVNGVAWHHYSAIGWSNPKLMLKHRQRIAKNVPFYFSEGSMQWIAPGMPKFAYGYMALRLIKYFRYGCSSYNGWVPILDTEGQPNNGPFHAKHSMIQRDVKTNQPIYNPDFYWLAHFSKYIQRGAYCIHIDQPSAKHLEMVAFRNPDNTIIWIAVNKAWKTQDLILNWNNLAVSISIPSQSIITTWWNI